MFSNKSLTSQRMLVILLAAVVLMAVVVEVDAKGLSRGGNIPIWDKSTHPPRGEFRLDWMGQLSDQVKSRLQGVCYDVLEKEDKPFYVYLGLQFGDLESVVGYSFRDEEWVTGLRLYPKWETWHAYSNLEYQLETKSFYYLAQAELHLSPFIECGAEVEGWGDLDDDMISNGVGLNMAFNLHAHQRWGKKDSKLRVEAAIQYRGLGGEWKPQAVVRFVFTPKPDEHTRSRRRH